MSMKAIRRQLIAAVAMVLVAAIALGSSTFAWFVTNSTVKADGMKVQAAAENGLEIKEATAGSTWASSATGLHATGNAVIPTSTKDATTWYHSSALAKNASTYDPATVETLTLTETAGVGKINASDEKGYYIHDQFQIRATNTNATNLQISSLTVDSTGDALAPGLRVLIKCGSNVFICAPITGATLSYNVHTSSTGSEAVTALAPADLYNEVLAATVDTTGIAVDVYVYFEGEDAAIKTDNIPDTLQKLGISIDFTATI